MDGLDGQHHLRKLDLETELAGVMLARRRPIFVVQRHVTNAVYHHVWLEFAGSLLSWVLPNGPSTQPRRRCLAVRTDDRSIEHATSEGVIRPSGVGGGVVMIWDQGHWKPRADVARSLRSGRLDFVLQGERLRGGWSLIRISDDAGLWVMVTSDDAFAHDAPFEGEAETSVVSGRNFAQIEADAAWEAEAKRVAAHADELH